jgi:hypothetical protein
VVEEKQQQEEGRRRRHAFLKLDLVWHGSPKNGKEHF